MQNNREIEIEREADRVNCWFMYNLLKKREEKRKMEGDKERNKVKRKKKEESS